MRVKQRETYIIGLQSDDVTRRVESEECLDSLRTEVGDIVDSIAEYLQSLVDKLLSVIASFHCHTIIKTIQQIKSRIKEERGDEYSNSVAKIQVCAMFRAGNNRRNVLVKFIRLCMETPCLCPSEGHKYGGRKLEKQVIEFALKSL